MVDRKVAKGDGDSFLTTPKVPSAAVAAFAGASTPEGHNKSLPGNLCDIIRCTRRRWAKGIELDVRLGRMAGAVGKDGRNAGA